MTPLIFCVRIDLVSDPDISEPIASVTGFRLVCKQCFERKLTRSDCLLLPIFCIEIPEEVALRESPLVAFLVPKVKARYSVSFGAASADAWQTILLSSSILGSERCFGLYAV